MQIEVVDDASSDDPEAVVEELGARARRASSASPRNVGHVANFNTCLERSRGRLVHLLHGDDCVRDGFYAAMERLLEREPDGRRGVLPLHRDRCGRATGATSPPLEQRRRGRDPEAGSSGSRVGQRLQTPCMVVRREAYERLGGFDGAAAFAEDWEMWVRIAAHYPVAYEPRAAGPVPRARASPATGRMLRTRRERPGPAPRDRDQPRALPARSGRCDRAPGAARDGHHLPAARPPAAGAGDTATARAQVREAVARTRRRGCSPRRLWWSRRATSWPCARRPR